MRHFTEVRKLITLNWKVLAGFENQFLKISQNTYK